MDFRYIIKKAINIRTEWGVFIEWQDGLIHPYATGFSTYDKAKSARALYYRNYGTPDYAQHKRINFGMQLYLRAYGFIK